MSAAPLPWEKYSQAAPASGPWEKYSQKPEAQAEPEAAPNQGLPPGEIPLTSYGAATAQGFANIGKGAIDAATGFYNTVRHPIDTAKGMIAAPGQLMQQAGQVPGAVRDINQSPDPAGTYAKVAAQTSGEGAGQAIVAAATPTAVKESAEAFVKSAKAVSRLTPKQAAQIAGGGGGAIAGHGTLSAPGAYYGAKTAGKIAEGVLGEERANAPIFGKKAAPVEPPDWWKERGGVKAADRPTGPIRGSGFTRPHPGPSEPPRPFVPETADALAQRQAESLGHKAIVDSAIPPQHAALNMQVKSQVNFYLKKGDVASAEKVLDTAAAKVNPSWQPERPGIVPAVRNIQENDAMVKTAEAQPGRRASDALEDRGIQQQMQQNLEQHGIRAEQEARREFIARNSTGVTKGELNAQFDKAMGKPVAPEKPVKYTKMPGIKSAPPAGTTVPQTSEEMVQGLQKSVEQAKAGKPSAKSWEESAQEESALDPSIQKYQAMKEKIAQRQGEVVAKRQNPPQVAQPIIKKRNVPFDSKTGEGKINQLKATEYILPGFEEYRIGVVNPQGSIAAHTKDGYSVYELTTGRRIYTDTYKGSTQQRALQTAMRMFNTLGKEKIDAAIAKAKAE